MRQFKTPPGWPDPPTPGWRPPRRWRPHKSWPPAPAGWAFWVDTHGIPVRGPTGRYGGPTRFTAGAILLAACAVMTLIVATLLTGPSANTPVPTRHVVGQSVEPRSTVVPTTPTVTAVGYHSCAAVRAAGGTPVRRGRPGYSRALDRNHDGIACGRGDF